MSLARIDKTPDVTVVHVLDDIDLATRDEFRRVLDAALTPAPPHLVVSLDGCPYIDCAGINVLLRTRNRTSVPISVEVSESSYLRKLFELMNLTDAFSIGNAAEPMARALG